MKIKRVYEYLIPVVLIVVLFFTLRRGQHIPPVAYAIIGALSAAYYFPARIIRNWSLKTGKENIFSVCINFLFGAAIVLSVMRLYTGLTPFIDYSCMAISFILLLVTAFQFINFKTGRDFFICLLINMLIALILR